MDLLALADFNLVAAHGGVGRASRASGRPKATLSRKVADLEESLGVRLFERGTRNLRLTEEGRALHERTAALLGEIAEVVEDVHSGTERPRGPLRVSAPALFSQLAMGRIAAGFAAAYPEVRLKVTVEDRPVDLVEEGYDVVIRINPAPDEVLVGKRFLRDELLVVAAPSLQRPAAAGSRVVPAVVLDSARDRPQWTMVDRPGEPPLTPNIIMRLGSMTIVRDAVLAGAGVALLPRSLVGADLKQARLLCWGKASEEDTQIWVLYSSRRLLSSKVSAFVAYLGTVFPNGSFEDLDRLSP